MIAVGVVGAGGRMGAEVCRAVSEEPAMELVAAIDPRQSGRSLRDVTGVDSDLEIQEVLSALADGGAEVAVDFTIPSSVVDNVKWCLENGLHAVVGTTGISESDVGLLAELSQRGSSNVLIAPNFAIGAVLMMKFAELAARWLPDAEIVELHHPGKLDSPSGTSVKTAKGIARGRSDAGAQPASTRSAGKSDAISPARGTEVSGVHVHSVRLPGLVAHQEVVFGGPGQTLTIRHDSIDRSSFMPGVLLAIREVVNRRGLTIGLEQLLGL